MFSDNVSVRLNTTCCFLTVTRVGSSVNVVTSSPSLINCGVTCIRAFALGTPVTLTAAPAPGFEFAGWSGAGCAGTSTCNVTMNADASVTVTFRFLIDPVTLPDALAGFPYTQTLTPEAGDAPFAFAVTSGTPPAGLTLSPGGC